MQHQNDLALNLRNLFEENSYVPFKQGYFVNQPNMTGYFYIFKNITKPKMCLILNMSEVKYVTNMTKIKDYVFMIFNVKSLEEFITNLSDFYIDRILTIIDQNLNKHNTRNLPYAYFYDENGKLKIDPRKAQEVRKIYNRYIETESVRQIADEMDTNFSHIRDILHDNEEYMQMQQKILPMTILKQINLLLAENVKGRYRKETTADKIKEVRKRREQAQKQQQMLQG